MTATHGGHRMRLTAVRSVPGTPDPLRVLGGHRRLLWWHRRVVLAAAVGGAMVGALLGVAQTYFAQGMVPLQLLQAYGAGAVLGAAAGLVLGLVLSVMFGLMDRYLLPQSVRRRPLWVRYRKTR